ncbi:LysR substrate-binding domain-containing protein [Candidatus Poriferisodalis sp.]|uniref:LysR substrate-binding domain-containing protein n=1 Tax=Candidatus Poriferisodalis sp. TaxID=3101277 RepID=UPI003B02A0A8
MSTRTNVAVGRPTIRQLEYLVALDAHGHIGRAAAACFVSQPTLSTQIRQLERHLGVTITERVGRGIVVTPAGRELAERARAVLRDTDEMLEWGRSSTDGLGGPLRIAAIPTAAPYLLARMLAVINERHPEVLLCLDELRASALVEALVAAQLDLGLMAEPEAHDDLAHTIILEDPLLLAMAPQHRLARQPSVAIDDLAGETVLLLEDGHCLRCQVLKVCRSVGAREVSKGGTSLATICQMVAAGMGVTLLPTSAAPIEARRGTGIVVRPFSDVTAKRQLALVWRRRSPAAPLYRELAELIAARLADVNSGSAPSPASSKPDVGDATAAG